MSSVKGSFMVLDQNDVPTGRVKIRSAILFNLFLRVDGNSLGSISA